MHIIALDEIAAQRVADLHRQAAKQRLLLVLRSSRKSAVHGGPRWEWLTVRHPRLAVLIWTPPANGADVAGGSQTAARQAG